MQGGIRSITMARVGMPISSQGASKSGSCIQELHASAVPPAPSPRHMPQEGEDRTQGLSQPVSVDLNLVMTAFEYSTVRPGVLREPCF